MIFVVGGNDVDDFFVNLTAVVGDRQTAEDILSHAAGLITPTSAGSAPTAPTVDQAAQNVQNAFPQAQQQAPHNQQAPTCAHGARTYREGNNKMTGKPWKAWFCPSSDRTNQCEAQWIR